MISKILWTSLVVECPLISWFFWKWRLQILVVSTDNIVRKYESTTKQVFVLKKKLWMGSQFWFTVPCWVGLPWCHWLIALSQWSLWDLNDQIWTYPGEQQVSQWNVWLELFERLIRQLCSWRQGEISQLDGFGQFDDNDLENKINSYFGVLISQNQR